MSATLLLLLLAADAAPPAEAAAPARRALQPFKGALKAALTQALEVSPVAAIDVCAKQAPELARTHSSGGVLVGRAAVKRRGPDGAGPAWVEAALVALAREPSGSEASRLVALPGGRTGYAEAIWVQPMCLTCHGEVLAPEVKAALQARYPKDQAVGFRAGDFRGVFWAELPSGGP